LLPLALLLASLHIPDAHASRVCSWVTDKNKAYGKGLLQSGAEVKLKLDAYVPISCDDGPVGARPWVLMVPGGGFAKVSRSDPEFVPLAEGLAAAGYAVFIMEHRLRDNTGDPPASETQTDEQIDTLWDLWATSPYVPGQHYHAMIGGEDAHKALKWIRKKAVTYGLDSNRAGMLGGSSGAVITMTTAYESNQRGWKNPNLKAVADLWGDLYPHEDIEAGEPDLLIVHGTNDTKVPYATTDGILSQAASVGVPAERITMEGASHGMSSADIFNREAYPPATPTVFDAIVEFFDRKL